MGMVEHHPGVMVLHTLGMLTHVKPLNAPRQDDGRCKRAGGQHIGSTPAGDPLEAD